MKKYALIAVALLIVVLAISFYMSRDKAEFNVKTDQQGQCVQTCNYIQSVCGNVVDDQSCLTNCQVWTDEMKEAIKGYDDCQFLVTELGLQLKTEQNGLVNQEDCSLACQNYTDKCLATIENADADTLQEGFNSCMSSCNSFGEEIVKCIIDSKTCDDMVQKCGL